MFGTDTAFFNQSDLHAAQCEVVGGEAAYYASANDNYICLQGKLGGGLDGDQRCGHFCYSCQYRSDTCSLERLRY
ncbi:hypothetical protein ALP66_103389 [Pseudomonas amygdali pv. photiniae]|uniref:Uncharacterized protein n=1 Tax=Pseudomonas amygdali pv. photiniae TaxID=251724 RepID=A0A658K281_PSEA0|nr:hypothetical protein ALP66_103389 [Pseudomonas amygdali pv. photiniae]